MKRSVMIPALLLVYLGVMAVLGYPEYAGGRTTAASYFGIIGITFVVIILLHFNIKHRDRLRRRRQDELNTRGESGSTDSNS